MNTVQLTDKFESALVYATRLHANQTRNISDVPYIAHLLSVAALVLEAGGTEEEAIAGLLLHDAVEDQGGKSTREEIRQRFGETVVAIVDGCTESDTFPKPPWSERKKKVFREPASCFTLSPAFFNSSKKVPPSSLLSLARSSVLFPKVRSPSWFCGKLRTKRHQVCYRFR